MKKNLMTLAFMLVFASMSALAEEGETGHGGRTSEPQPTPTPTVVQPSSSSTVFDQFLNIIYAVIA